MVIKIGKMTNFKLRLVPILSLFAAALVLIINCAYYFPFLSDDSLISLRYVSRFLDGHGLTWTEGHPVEGYSNLLWILLIAGLGYLGLDLVVAARLIGFSCSLISLLLFVRWHYEKSIHKSNLALITALLFYSFSGIIGTWSIGGLEQPLITVLVTYVFLSNEKILESDSSMSLKIRVSLALGLICITRPDGPLFAVVVFISWIISDKYWSRNSKLFSTRDYLILLFFPVLFYGAQLAFRLWYYGEWVPNTALVKISPSLMHVGQGVKYVSMGLISLMPFSLFGLGLLIYLVRYKPFKKTTFFSILMLVVWLGYVVAIGGDIFPSYRHLMPMLGVFVFLVYHAANFICQRLDRNIVIIGILVSFVFYLGIQVFLPEYKRAIKERWEFEGEVLGKTLYGAFNQEQPLVAVSAAGCIPYWSNLPSLDMLGLNDYYLPRNPPEDFGDGYLGHELGSGSYVLEMNPCIIVNHVGDLKTGFNYWSELEKSTEFKERFIPSKVVVSGQNSYNGFIWINKYSEKIGASFLDGSIEVPGYLFNNDQKNLIVKPDEYGKLVLMLPPLEKAEVNLNTQDNEWMVKKESYPKCLDLSVVQDISGEIVIQLSSGCADSLLISNIKLLKVNED